MSTVNLHPTPAWSDVAREQVRAVGLILRREALLFALLMIAISALILISYVRGLGDPDGQIGADFSPAIAAPVVLLAFFVGMSVWRSQEPSSRSYMWSLPVERTRHTLTRVGAGWAWLVALLVAYMLVVLALTLITGGEIGQGSATVYLGEREMGAMIDSAMIHQVTWSVIHQVTWSVPAWEWAVPFVAITIAYIIGSIVPILSDHPWRWFAGIPLAFWLTIVVLQLTGMEEVGRGIVKVLTGEYGLFTALSGEGTVPQEFTRPDGATVRREISRPVLTAWLPAAALWLAVASAGVFAAARVHQER